jgi:hypothetical protein
MYPRYHCLTLDCAQADAKFDDGLGPLSSSRVIENHFGENLTSLDLGDANALT